MTPLEKKRKEVELIRVRAARAEMEFKILELEDAISRIQGNIDIQKGKEDEIEKDLAALV